MEKRKDGVATDKHKNDRSKDRDSEGFETKRHDHDSSDESDDDIRTMRPKSVLRTDLHGDAHESLELRRVRSGGDERRETLEERDSSESNQKVVT